MQSKPKKSLGQNFLLDKNIINKIINAARISSDDVVLEIGPGTGNLTKFIISNKPKKIYVVVDSFRALSPQAHALMTTMLCSHQFGSV